MDKVSLNATDRKITGRKVKQLRRDGIIPANVYGKDIDSKSISVELGEFKTAYEKAGETVLVDLKVGSKITPVLISNIQTHPLTEEILHIDFREVDLKSKITTNVPIELVGVSPADKRGEGILVQQMDEIEIECLPTDIPEHIEADVSGLEEVDSAILVKDLKIDSKKIEVHDDPEQIIAKVEAPQEEKEEPAPAEGGEETEAETEDSEADQESSEETPKTEE